MSKVSLHSLLSRRLAAGLAAAEARGAVWDDEGLETAAEMTRVFMVEEEGGGWGAASGWFTLRKLMERCGDRRETSQGKNAQQGRGRSDASCCFFWDFLRRFYLEGLTNPLQGRGLDRRQEAG